GVNGGAIRPVATISGPDSGLNFLQGIAVDSKGKIYATNCPACLDGTGSDTVTVYAPGSSSDAKPIATISGPGTGLHGPQGVAVDSNGKIYVANGGDNTLTVYASGSNGDAKPVATISGPDTGLSGPASIALDSNGNIYVANFGFGSVTVYAPGSN